MYGFYASYKAFYAVPYVSSAFYLPSSFAGLFSIAMLSKFLQRNQNIARIYLMESGNILRLTYGNGNQEDVPLSALQFRRA
jgi:hypothetical protein